MLFEVSLRTCPRFLEDLGRLAKGHPKLKELTKKKLAHLAHDPIGLGDRIQAPAVLQGTRGRRPQVDLHTARQRPDPAHALREERARGRSAAPTPAGDGHGHAASPGRSVARQHRGPALPPAETERSVLRGDIQEDLYAAATPMHWCAGCGTRCGADVLAQRARHGGGGDRPCPCPASGSANVPGWDHQDCARCRGARPRPQATAPPGAG